MIKQVNKKNTFLEKKRNYIYKSKIENKIEDKIENNNLVKKEKSIKVSVNKNNKKNTTNNE